MKKFIPLLFQTHMVQAIIANTKTMTRRLKGLEYINENPDHWKFLDHSGNNFDIPFPIDKGRNGQPWYKWFTSHGRGIDFIAQCPYGMPGDVIWVRETFEMAGGNYHYKTDEELPLNKWKPGIHMPMTACRLFLEVVNIRVERLQDITEEDAIAEGIVMNNIPHAGWFWMEGVYSTDSAQIAFEDLWDKINGNWDANPFVWVASFRKVDKPAEWDEYVRENALKIIKKQRRKELKNDKNAYI